MSNDFNCFGCRLANHKEPVYVVYEDNFVCCILDHEPFNRGHVLILPKKHYRELEQLDVKTADAIMRLSIVISKSIKLLYDPDGITVCQNGGLFNELSHVHFHVVPRYKNQSFSDFYQESNTVYNGVKESMLTTMHELSRVIPTFINK